MKRGLVTGVPRARKDAACPWRISCIAAASLAVAAPAAALPVDVSGSVGYTFRALEGGVHDTASNQVVGNLHASSYLWKPWFATVVGGVTIALDSSDVEDNGSTSTSESTIVTGDVGLHVLPQSHVPFQLRYQRTDSRVDETGVRNPVITLAEDFKTEQLEVRQAYVTPAGHRLEARYDTRSWESDLTGTYEDDRYGLDFDWRPEKQRLTGRTSYQTTDQSRTDRHQQNVIVDLDHYIFPTDAFRVDTKASVYDLDTEYDGNAGITGSTNVQIAQASSFAFWRPENSPWTVSGGVRVLDMQGSSSESTEESDQFGVSGMLGAFYQYTKRLRLDANISYSTLERTTVRDTSSVQRVGALYQSDLMLWRGFNYQWFAQGGFENSTDPDETAQTFTAILGHDAQRTWQTGDTAFLRASVSQGFNETMETGDEDSVHRLDHSVSLAWSQTATQGTTLVQATLADMRHLSDAEDNEQLLNLQASRTQTVSQRSSLSGHFTIQAVRNSFPGETNHDFLTTATGQVNFEHQRAFGVPRLRFQSNLYMSRASLDEGVDRAEWENRLDYTIGLLVSSLSLRLMDDGQDNTSLLYFRVTRRF